MNLTGAWQTFPDMLITKLKALSHPNFARWNSPSYSWVSPWGKLDNLGHEIDSHGPGHVSRKVLAKERKSLGWRRSKALLVKINGKQKILGLPTGQFCLYGCWSSSPASFCTQHFSTFFEKGFWKFSQILKKFRTACTFFLKTDHCAAWAIFT